MTHPQDQEGSGSKAGASALQRPHHAQGIRGAHIGGLWRREPWKFLGLVKQAWHGQEAHGSPGCWALVGRVPLGQAQGQAVGFGLVHVVSILKEQLPEAAGLRIKERLEDEEKSP